MCGRQPTHMARTHTTQTHRSQLTQVTAGGGAALHAALHAAACPRTFPQSHRRPDSAPLEGRDEDGAKGSESKPFPLYNLSLKSSQVFALSGTNRDENMRFQVWKSIMKGQVLEMEIDGVTMYMHFDSHANMVVLGQECLVIAERKDKCSVSAFVAENMIPPLAPHRASAAVRCASALGTARLQGLCDPNQATHG